MAKQKQGKQVAAAPAKSGGKVINRKRRNAAERKSLPKAYKILFARDGHSWMRLMTQAWKDARDKSKFAAAQAL